MTDPNLIAEEKTPRRWPAMATEALSWAASFATHAAVLVALATLTWLAPPEIRPPLFSAPPPPEPEPIEDAFRVSAELKVDVGALAEGGVGDAAAAAPIEAELNEVALDLETVAEQGDILSLRLPTPSLTSPDPNDNLLVQGVGAVGAAGSSGAVDRITNEILLSLDQRPTLVVWLFDRSGSLSGQREEIVGRFDRVYEQLGVISDRDAQEFRKHDEIPLLTAIAAFGAEVDFLTAKPIDDVDELKSAVRSISEDDSGQENVFGALLDASDRYKRYRLKRPRRNVMFLVVTDEAGDDLDRLDRCVDRLRKLQTPVYVVGTPAPFGRQDAYVRYVDPDPQYDQSTQWLPVRQGPESLFPERLKLGAIGGRDFNGPMLDSGFGPFGLTRVANETGGFFIAVHPFRVDAGRANRRGARDAMASELDYFFDTRLMRRYRPDYVTVAEYRRRVADNAAKRALVEAAGKSWAEQLGNVRRAFPKQNDAQLADDLSRAQRDAAILEPALTDLVATLRRGERDRDELREPRWQAGFDLALGRALAAKVRAEGYNAMLARAKNGLAFQNPRNDTWVIAPSQQIATGSQAETEAADATEYLRRVAEEHEGTPWALLAQRELKQPMGWAWREEFRNVAAMVAQRNDNQSRPQERPERRPPPRRPPPKL